MPSRVRRSPRGLHARCALGEKNRSGLHFTVDLLSAEVSARPVRAASAPGSPARPRPRVGVRPRRSRRVFHLISHFRVPSPRSRPRKRFVFRADFTLESAIAPYWALCISGLRPRGPPPPGSRLWPPGAGAKSNARRAQAEEEDWRSHLFQMHPTAHGHTRTMVETVTGPGSFPPHTGFAWV